MSELSRHWKEKEYRKMEGIRQSEMAVFFVAMKEYNLPKNEIANLIDQWIMDDKVAEIVSLRLLKNHTYEQIAEEVGMSARHMPRIVDKSILILKKHGLKVIK